MGRILRALIPFSYNAGWVRVILDVLVTPSEVGENRPMLNLMWSTALRWQLWPLHVTGYISYW